MKSYQVGYSKQIQNGIRPRRHVVVPVADGWKLACSGKGGDREYRGFASAVNCRDCRALIAEGKL